MTNYPNSQDNEITLPSVTGTSEEDYAITALREATFAIEKELGLTPSGVYTDVRCRFDILESRINYGVSAIIPNDGYVKSPLYIFNVPSNITLSLSDGYGSPTEDRLNGSLYMRADGYANNDFYIRRDGYWVPIQTEQWIAAGDLSGNHLSQTVIGIQGKSLDVSLASVGAVQDGYHLTWDDGYWRAETGFIAGSDLAIDSIRFGRIGQKVIRLQNRSLSSAAPGGATASDGDILIWNPLASEWQPHDNTMIFMGSINANDGYTTRTNISSNKALQSPSNVTGSKVGMINFGSRSSGATTGTTENYAAILSGDRGKASGNFSLIVGGDNNQANGQYSTVINGLTNIINSAGQYSFIANGTNNTVNGIQSFILDGYSNTTNNSNSFVLAGGNNTADGYFSNVLNGTSNIVTSGANYASVVGGNANTVAVTGLFSIILGGSNNIVNSQNNLIGMPTSSSIAASSNFATILNGQTNAVAASSTSAFIGNGNNITVTGLYATVLNANTAVANGLHSLVLNGNTNSVTASYSTIANGNNNTISGGVSYSTILDGYSNAISGTSSWVGDGYGHTITGLYSTILNGNTNTISGNSNAIINGSHNNINIASINSIVLNGISNTISGNSNAIINGSLNNINITSINSIVLNGISNTLTNSSRSLVLGNSNQLTANSVFAMGDDNQISGQQSFANGNLNTISAARSTTWGLSNTVSGSLGYNNVFGQLNSTGAISGYNLISGLSNQVDGYYSLVTGERNVVTTDGYHSSVHGKFAKARVFGQKSQAVSNFTGTNAGEAQFSRVILTGSGAAGSPFPALIPGDGYLTFEDGKSYDINIRVLIVNNQSPLVNPTKPARFIYDILASQEAGALTIHDKNDTLINQNGTGWSVTVSAIGNQLQINVDVATFPQSPIPFNTSTRRAIVTVEWREITRA